jgi:hypothetical protein
MEFTLKFIPAKNELPPPLQEVLVYDGIEYAVMYLSSDEQEWYYGYSAEYFGKLNSVLLWACLPSESHFGETIRNL